MPSEIHYFPSHDSEGMDQSGRLMTHPNGGSFNPYMNACEYCFSMFHFNFNVTIQESHI
jgi:hypothetical protein